MDERLRQAIEENVAWCDRVTRAHGGRTESAADRWWTPERAPELFPDVITRAPGLVAAGDVLAGVDVGRGCSVKDSFASLDLRAAGFEVLVEARWLYRPAVEPEATKVRWRPALGFGPVLGALRMDPSVHLLDGGGPGLALGRRMVVHDAGDVVGVSNVQGDVALAWEDAGRLASPRPLVGYESGDDLEAAVGTGAVDVGPLRVWLRPHR